MPKTTDPRVARGRKVLARRRLQIMSRQKSAAGAETKARIAGAETKARIAAEEAKARIAAAETEAHIKRSEQENTLNFFRLYDSVACFKAVVYAFYGDDGSVVRLDSPTLDSPT